MSAFVKPTGAHRNTQSPHIVDFQGAVSSSTSSLPAPAVSALNNEYIGEINRLAKVLNQIQPGGIEVHEFQSLSGFTETLALILGPAVARAQA
jgi:CRISPR-associated protein Cst2